MVRKRLNVNKVDTPASIIVELIQLKLLAKMDGYEELAMHREEGKYKAKLAAENSACLLEMRHEKEMMALKREASQ